MLDADLLCDRVAFIVNGTIAALDTPKKLKEQNSSRRVRIVYLHQGRREEKIIETPELESGIPFAYDELISIHLEEPTLEEMFIQYTGRGVILMWGNFYSLFKKDWRMMLDGKIFLVAFGSLVLYTVFINFGYIRFMNEALYKVYLYDPDGTQQEVSERIFRVASLQELEVALLADANGVGIDASLGTPDIIMYFGSKKADHHRADYALSLLDCDDAYTARIIGTNTREQKQRKELLCKLLFIEIVAVGFWGIASVLFKEKQMGVVRVHVVLPFQKGFFILSKIVVFLLADLLFAVLLLNIGFPDAAGILPAVLVQTAVLSLIMALTGFGCTMLLKDFRQFSLAYLLIAVFAGAPVFLSANTSVKMDWINWHPFYYVYMGLKNAYFGTPVTRPVYYGFAVCGIAVGFLIVYVVFRGEL